MIQPNKFDALPSQSAKAVFSNLYFKNQEGWIPTGA